jgi:hypothetical protein
MVNAINGQGHGHVTRTLPQSSLPSATKETTEPVQELSRPGKGNAGAPGQLAKQMLGGPPPVGFSLGNLVSLIAQNDMEGAQSLVNSLAPPPAEEPKISSEIAVEIESPETTDPTIPLPIKDQSTIDTVAVVESTEKAEETASLSSDATSETSLLDLFEIPAEEEGTI